MKIFEVHSINCLKWQLIFKSVESNVTLCSISEYFCCSSIWVLLIPTLLKLVLPTLHIWPWSRMPSLRLATRRVHPGWCLFSTETLVCIHSDLPLPSTCWPSTLILTARGVGPTCAQPSGQDWHRRRSSWPEKKVGSLKCFGFELSIGKGAGSYKIAKAVAEKSKEKVVVAKKVEIPKKAVKKVAEGNFEFNDYGCIVSKAKLRTRKLHRRRRRRARPAVAKAQRGQRLKRLWRSLRRRHPKVPLPRSLGKVQPAKLRKVPRQRRLGKVQLRRRLLRRKLPPRVL